MSETASFVRLECDLCIKRLASHDDSVKLVSSAIKLLLMILNLQYLKDPML